MSFRVASLIGTARPRPMPATAVLMPTTRPRPSASAPPELPGLRAASVWITFSTRRPADPERVGSERPRAETTPAVTVPGEAHGAADRDDQLADAQLVGVAELRRLPGRAHRRGPRPGRRGGRRRRPRRSSSRPSENEAVTPVSAGDDVGRGEHVAVRGDRDAAAGALRAAAAGAARDCEVGDRGVSRSATPETVREYASKASASGRRSAGDRRDPVCDPVDQLQASRDELQPWH